MKIFIISPEGQEYNIVYPPEETPCVLRLQSQPTQPHPDDDTAEAIIDRATDWNNIP